MRCKFLAAAPKVVQWSPKSPEKQESGDALDSNFASKPLCERVRSMTRTGSSRNPCSLFLVADPRECRGLEDPGDVIRGGNLTSRRRVSTIKTPPAADSAASKDGSLYQQSDNVQTYFLFENAQQTNTFAFLDAIDASARVTDMAHMNLRIHNWASNWRF